MAIPFFVGYKHTYFVAHARAVYYNKSEKIEAAFSNKRSLRLKDL
jgi:hypothetical protein